MINRNTRRKSAVNPNTKRGNEIVRRGFRFEDLEPRYLMTAAGWESPLSFPALEQHGSLEIPTGVEMGVPHSSHGFINLRDYNGNLLENWEELVAAEAAEHEHYDSLNAILPFGAELDSGDIPIEEQFALSGEKWPQSGGLGSPTTITYSYSNILNGTLLGITADQIKAGVEKALQLWSNYAPLNFVEVVDSGPAAGDTSYSPGTTPNLRIGYHAMDGASQVLAHAYYPQANGLAGDVHFDSAETWRIGAGAGGIDFVEVALHEFGHALGLLHETTNSAIMNPYYGGRFGNLNAAYLLQDDINGIRALYGTGTGSVTPIVVNHTPVLNAIGDVSMSRSQNSVNVTLTATDSDNDPITFSATASQYPAVDLLAYQLDQQYGFSLNGSDYYNYRGAGEKYVTGSGGQWYFILPTGALYSWNTTIANSTQIATLDSSFHTNLSKLYNAQLGAGSAVSVGLTFNSNVLTIDPASNFTGTFQVNVNASDGNTSASRTFSVTVTNQAPTLSAIADQSMRPSDDAKSVGLTFSDADGDAVSVTASVAQADSVKAAAYSLDQQYQFQAASSDYYNYRGAGEKYFQNPSGNYYYILANGKVYSWGGSIAGSTLLATLDSRFHTDLSLLYNAQPDLGAPSGVSLVVNGNTLTVNPPNGYTGSFQVTVTASDGTASTQRTFVLDVANHAPTLNAIADQSMAPGTPSKVVVVQASDSDGDTLSYSATAGQVDAVAQQAYDLDQQRKFQAGTSEYYNYRGASEKYFVDNAGTYYFILPNSQVYSWGGSLAGSTLLATLNSTYYTTPSLLYNAQAPTVQPINAGLTWNGSSLTVSPPNGFTGSFQVTVTASDGSLTASDTFIMSVVNHAPQISAIANQNMSPSANTMQVAVTATDSDGDNLTYTLSAVQVDAIAQTAYDLDQQYNFQASSSEYLNYRGSNEKYFQNAAGNWYFILSNGNVYAFVNTIQQSTLLGQLDASYYANLTKLYNVAAPTETAVNVGLQMNSGQLTVDPPNGFAGNFRVKISVSDGSLSAQTSFQVTLANQAPTLAAIANQAMSSSQDFIQVPYMAADADGDPLTMTATASQIDPIAQLAYNLDQQYGFYATPEYYNLRGVGEKYFQGNGGAWFYILANGQVYSWGGSIAGSTLLATLSSSYHSNLSLIYNAQQPSAASPNVALSASNGVLTINPANGFTGQFTVTLTASDGAASAVRTFAVTVSGNFTAPASMTAATDVRFADASHFVIGNFSTELNPSSSRSVVASHFVAQNQQHENLGQLVQSGHEVSPDDLRQQRECSERMFANFNRTRRNDDIGASSSDQSDQSSEPSDEGDEQLAIDVIFSMLGV